MLGWFAAWLVAAGWRDGASPCLIPEVLPAHHLSLFPLPPPTPHPPIPHARYQAVRGKPMSKDEVELLWRVYDTNAEGFLEVSEMVRIQDTIDDSVAAMRGGGADDTFASTHLL